MNFSELKAELQARGFDMISDTRAGRMINTAYLGLCGLYQWPFLEDSAVGTAPLQISDLGTIEAVIVTSDSNRELAPATFQWLISEFGDLSADGTPEYYYVANPSGSLQVAIYPEDSSVTIGVQYYEIPAELTGTDTPVVPTRFHDIIVDMAMIQAYRSRDNHGAAEGLQAHVDRRIAQMVAQQFTQQIQGPEFQQIRAGSEDW